jgi:hypothetical protein
MRRLSTAHPHGPRLTREWWRQMAQDATSGRNVIAQAPGNANLGMLQSMGRFYGFPEATQTVLQSGFVLSF